MSLVSVILPTYNRAALVGEAIESVLRQTYANLELIVVDDGSSDATPRVLESYRRRDARIRPIVQSNRGAAVARNRAIEVARGPWVAFLDDDDLWMEAKLEHQVAQMEGAQHAAFTFSMCVVEEGGTRLGTKPAIVREHSWETLVHGNFIPISTVMVRRSCLELCGGFREGLAGTEDYDLWLRIARRFPFTSIPEPMAIYRRHGANMSARPGIRFQQAHVQIFQEWLGDDALSRAERTAIIRRLAKELHLLGKAHLSERRYTDALRTFMRAIRTNPLAGTAFITPTDRLPQRLRKVLNPYLAAGHAWLASVKAS